MKYYLVLEKRPNEFMTIDINILLNNTSFKNYLSLESIDMFTKNYNLNELYELIKNNNIVPDAYLKGNLKIINEKKYRYPVFTKEINLSLDNFFKDNINDKLIMNKIVNIFQKFNKEGTNRLKESIKLKDIDEILKIIFSQPYEDVRKLYFYIVDNL